MIGAVAFASCYIYSPAGEGLICERSRLLRSLIKEGDARFMTKYAARVREQARLAAVLGGFFHRSDVLVPVPGSTQKKHGIWVAAELAEALVQEGLGAMMWPGLRRIRAVRKSATAAHGERPSVGLHYSSFRMESPSIQPRRVILIDDVITRGRTLLAAAARAQEALPDAEIRAFALLRTKGLVAGVDHLLEPCRGEIRWTHGDARRDP